MNPLRLTPLRLSLLMGSFAALLSPPTAHASAGFRLGFTDPVYSDQGLAGPYLDRTVASGADLVLTGGSWASIASRRPANPTDPSDPAYDWRSLDATLRGIAERGLEPVVALSAAPTWAEGPRRPHGAARGSWRPDPSAFGAFAEAATTRYSGAFADPSMPGRSLPRVREWQAWAEPNLNLNITPQWVRGRRGYRPASPAIYRSLLNAFYRAVKGATPSDEVITAGTAPFGDPNPGGARIAPAEFDRELLCLTHRCAHPPRFDVLAHHPYAVGAPDAPALNADDVSVPDLHKLTALLSTAHRRGLLPGHRRKLWVTEFSYDSKPPDPQGVPAARHARWLAQALYEFWRQGASVVIWYHVRDEAPIPDYASTYQSGIYLLDGTPKLAARAFRFPFATERTSRGALRVWGRSPVAGTVEIQSLGAAGWRTIARRTAGAHGVFVATVRARGRLRATVADDSSLAF